MPCAHSDCAQGSAEPTITKIVGRPGARRAVTFAAVPLPPRKVRVSEKAYVTVRPWTWSPVKTEFLMEVTLGGGRVPGPDEVLRAALGLA